MPFAFSQLRPRTTGIISKTPIPLSEFLSTSFDQGVNDSALMAISRIQELSLLEHGPILSPEDANKQYGIRDRLEFTDPTYENVARVMRERKDQEMYREFVLSQGSPGLLSARGAAGLMTMMAGNIANPLDFALNFIPIVGAEKAGVYGAATVARASRYSLARGLVTRQALGRAIPNKKLAFLAESFIEGSIGAGVTEIPLFVSNAMDQANYTAGDFAINTVFGGAFNTAINAAVRSAARVFNVLQASTKEAMMKQAMEQLTTGRDVNVADQARLDDNAVRQSVRRKVRTRKQEAAMQVDPDDLKKAVLDMYRGKAKTIRPVLDFGEETYATTALHHISPHSDFDVIITQKSGKGERELFLGESGQSVQELQQKAKIEAHLGRANFLQRDIPKAKAYYQVLDKEGKVVQEFPINKLPEVLGLEEPFVPRDLITEHRVRQIVKSDPEMRRRFNEARKAGASVNQALDEVRDAIRQKDAALFFEQPNVKKELEQERLRRINEILRKNQERFAGGKDNELETEQQQAIDQGHSVSEENVKEWNVKATNAREPMLSTKAMKDEETKFMANMKEQMDAIMAEIPEAEWKADMPKDRSKDLDAALKQAIDCILTAN